MERKEFELFLRRGRHRGEGALGVGVAGVGGFLEVGAGGVGNDLSRGIRSNPEDRAEISALPYEAGFLLRQCILLGFT